MGKQPVLKSKVLNALRVLIEETDEIPKNDEVNKLLKSLRDFDDSLRKKKGDFAPLADVSRFEVFKRNVADTRERFSKVKE
jgi:hypothetical protein